MILGVTGTREGLSERQDIAVRGFLIGLYTSGLNEIHHGCCIGADARIHELCSIEGAINIPIIIHPPINTKNMAVLSGEKERKLPKEYMERNKDIVLASDLMLVMPKTKYEQIRSGTWACYRFACKMLKPIVMVYPDGSIEFIQS